MESELNDYINAYVEIVLNYINTINTSKITVSNRKLIESIGFRAITHIFQLNYINSKCLITSFNSCKKAIMFYIEYMEQAGKANVADAVTFIYNKMIITDPKTSIIINYPISRVSKLVDILLWWNNPEIEQIKIPRDLIINFACLSDSDFINSYLEVAQNRKMDMPTYLEFLTETYWIIQQTNKIPNNYEWICGYVHKKPDWENNLKMPIKKWCKWLYYPLLAKVEQNHF
jgi:hypothetical protein